MNITKHIEQAIAELTMAGVKFKESFYAQPDSRDSAKLHRQYHTIKKLIGQLEEIQHDILLSNMKLPDRDYFIISRRDVIVFIFGIRQS
jgi:enoyl-[acyl-carrier-protein] reductase (NADH)